MTALPWILAAVCRQRNPEVSAQYMHLPDAFLDGKTILLTAGATGVGITCALRQVQRTIQPRQVPLLGLAGAFVFAAQMLNFPVPGGTSGHLLGGVLAAVLLGPAAAVLVMTCVLFVQCLVFADGGLLALGANVFNMGIVNACGGYLVFRAVKRLFPMEERRGTVFAAGFAGWAGTVLSAILCAGELAFSGAGNWAVTFPAMANIHMLIGLGEGLATAMIVLGVLRQQGSAAVPVLTNGNRPEPGFLLFGGLICCGLALFVAPFACPWPDGLETVAQRLGFAGVQQAFVPVKAPFANYELPMTGAVYGTAVAGLVGTVVAFAAAYLLARLLVPTLKESGNNASSRV